jgi:hypothetical protein
MSASDETQRIERIELAEHYYAVTGHMRAEIARMNEIIEVLTRIADGICAASARQASGHTADALGAAK